MKQDSTNEFSFKLKPSKHGVGVFAMHDIKKSTYLRLFGDEKPGGPLHVRYLKEKDIPEAFKGFRVAREKGLAMCPKDFGHMEIGWYINHSKNPNAMHKNYHFYARRDISAGEEITIDYNALEEPEETKETYYK